MPRWPLFTIVALIGCMGCTYDPAFELTCDTEGATVDDRRCENGYWVTQPSATVDAESGALTDVAPDSATTENSSNVDMGIESDLAPPADGGADVRPGDAGDTIGDAGADVSLADVGPDLTIVDAGTDMPRVDVGFDMPVDAAADVCIPETDGEFCSRHVANCGSLTEVDNCGTPRTVASCGTCDVNASCLQNACTCNMGWMGNGLSCTDVDECAMGTDNCGPSEMCQNTMGSFLCDPAGIVDSVEHVSVDLTGAQAMVSLTLPAGNAIPFVTKSLTDSPNGPKDYNVDVYVQGGDLFAVRDDSSGTVTVEVAVVQFDPAEVHVQTGTFEMQGTTSDMVTLPSPLSDAGAAFNTFTFRSTSSSPGHRPSFIASEFMGLDRLAFTRDDSGTGDSGDGDVFGHWYVAEAVNGGFSVQHVSVPDMMNFSQSASISTDVGKSFVLYSHHADAPDASGAHVNCWLAASEVKCERSDNSNTVRNIRAQVVEFLGNETVEHGVLTLGSGTVAALLTNPVSPATAIVVNGVNGMSGASSTDGADDPAGYTSLRFLMSGGGVEAATGGTAGTIEVRWSVIQF